MQEVIVQDQHIPACPGLSLSPYRALSYIRSCFWRVPAPEAKDLEGVQNFFWNFDLLVQKV